MNYAYLLVGAYLAFLNAPEESSNLDTGTWERFKTEYNKNYENQDVERLRKLIFAYNKQHVDLFNSKQNGDQEFELGINHLSDLTELEMTTMKGFRVPKSYMNLEQNYDDRRYLREILSRSPGDIPDSVDWRKVPGRVSRVKNQGMCGSCWAFATTGALEGQETIVGKYLGANMTELSEQNLVDCDPVDQGCNGGFMKDAFEFIQREGGIENEQDYPYVARRRKCKFRRNLVKFSDAGAAVLPEGDEQKLKEVVAKYGPVAVAIDASKFSFQAYRKGIYYEKHCHNKLNQLDHAVLVVGYGTDPEGGDYWIVKNSWGPHYGQGGYIFMARNRKNNCGIATIATIPKL